MDFVQFIQNHGTNICNQNNKSEFTPVKFLIMASSLVLELQIVQERSTESGIKFRTRSEFSLSETMDGSTYPDAVVLYQKFANVFLSIMVLGTNWTKLMFVFYCKTCFMFNFLLMDM